MKYFYLISSILLVASTNVCGSFYSRKNMGRKIGVQLYNFLLLCAVFICWAILFLTDGSVHIGVLPYALGFSACFTLYNVATINALKTGSLMLTALFGKLSLILVSVWGFLFWEETFTWITGIGLGLTAIALWLCLYSGKQEKKGKLSLSWIGYVALVLFGNAGCSIIQRTQQMRFEGKYGNFLMFVATGVSAIVCLILFLRSDKSEAKATAKTSWYFPVLAGVFNAMMNLFVILMASTDLPPSLIYPVLAVGSLIVITLFSLFVFKERMRWWQWLGVVLGSIAMGILSL